MTIKERDLKGKTVYEAFDYLIGYDLIKSNYLIKKVYGKKIEWSWNGYYLE